MRLKNCVSLKLPGHNFSPRALEPKPSSNNQIVNPAGRGTTTLKTIELKTIHLSRSHPSHRLSFLQFSILRSLPTARVAGLGNGGLPASSRASTRGCALVLQLQAPHDNVTVFGFGGQTAAVRSRRGSAGTPRVVRHLPEPPRPRRTLIWRAG